MVEINSEAPGILELLNLDSKKRWEIIRSLDPLKDSLEYLIVDTPAERLMQV